MPSRRRSRSARRGAGEDAALTGGVIEDAAALRTAQRKIAPWPAGGFRSVSALALAVLAVALGAAAVFWGYAVASGVLGGVAGGAVAYWLLVHWGAHPSAKRIILVRHGESLGNIDFSAYTRIPDHSIPLTDKGRAQARDAGRRIKEIIGDEPVLFFVSPYERTRETYSELRSQLAGNRVLKAREESRIREQEFGGTFQDQALQHKNSEQRDKYGKFFFRPNGGESGADVMDRVTTFLDTLFRAFRKTDGFNANTNVILVTHGLTLRVFLMRFFHWSVALFERTRNPENCGFVVLELQTGFRFYRMRPESAKVVGLQPDELWSDATDTVRCVSSSTKG